MFALLGLFLALGLALVSPQTRAGRLRELGYFDYRMTGERFDDGYQSVPVNWTISSPRKREFFALLSKVTGVGSLPGKTVNPDSPRVTSEFS